MAPVPTSDTPSSTPAWRRKSASGHSAPSQSPSSRPSTARLPSAVWSVAIRRVRASSASGAAPPKCPLCSAPLSVRRVTVSLPWPRRVCESVGSPTFQLPLSAITITSARSSSGWASTTPSSAWRPFSSEPSMTTFTWTGGLPSKARSAARWATMPDLSSDAPRP